MKDAIRWLVGVAAVLALTAGVAAHEFWIQPLPWRPETGALVKFDFRLGDEPPGELFPRKDKIIERFEVVDPSGKVTPIVGADGQSPAGLSRPTTEGIHIIAYRSKPSAIELDAAKFEAYLKEEGLEKIIEQRAAAGQSSQPGREMFSRCAKCIMRVGQSGGSAGFDRVLGLTLEIIPETDPTLWNAGDTARARLIHSGKPCAGALVLAKCLNDQKSIATMTTRTDESGQFKFDLPVGSAGAWMFSAVEMVKASAGVEINGVKPEWESLWASMTFENGANGAKLSK